MGKTAKAIPSRPSSATSSRLFVALVRASKVRVATCVVVRSRAARVHRRRCETTRIAISRRRRLVPRADPSSPLVSAPISLPSVADARTPPSSRNTR